jgi:hypothetical protein
MDKEKIICSGSYYNFKKGMEFCKNSSKCGLYDSDYYHKISNLGHATFRFQDIKDFRTCKRFIPKDKVPF